MKHASASFSFNLILFWNFYLATLTESNFILLGTGEK